VDHGQSLDGGAGALADLRQPAQHLEGLMAGLNALDSSSFSPRFFNFYKFSSNFDTSLDLLFALLHEGIQKVV